MTFRLPVSGRLVATREPGGHDELLLLVTRGGGFALRLEFARRLTPLMGSGTGPAADWEALAVPDLDAALLGLRRELLGDRLVAEVRCSECGALGDLTFSVSDWLKAHAPDPPRSLGCEPKGWPRWEGLGLRLPTVAAYLEAEAAADSPRDLAQRLEAYCLGELQGPQRTRACKTLERLAPPQGGEVEGRCPECDRALRAWLEPGDFVLAELRQRALRLHEEVHLIASAYGWSEAAILDLPGGRRALYAELISAERLAAA